MLEKPTSHKERLEKRETSREMTKHEAVELAFWSFYYSQGNPGLQKNILESIARQNEDLRFPDFSSNHEFGELAFPLFKKFLDRGIHSYRLDSAVSKELQRVYTELSAYFGFQKARTTWSDRELLQNVAMDILQKDSEYAGYERGNARPVLRDKSTNDRVSFPGPFRLHMSQFVDYIILTKHAPGPQVYEKLMATIREHATDPGFMLPEMRDEFVTIINDHNAHHPAEQVDLEGLLKKFYPAREADAAR